MDKNQILKSFSANLKRLRTENNFSQAALAKELNLARITIAQIESGKYFVTAETLASLCDVLKCKPLDFFKE